jgi:hypothetical protein
MAPERTARLLQGARAGARAEADELGALLAIMDHPDAAWRAEAARFRLLDPGLRDIEAARIHRFLARGNPSDGRPGQAGHGL